MPRWTKLYLLAVPLLAAGFVVAFTVPFPFDCLGLLGTVSGGALVGRGLRLCTNEARRAQAHLYELSKRTPEKMREAAPWN